MEKTTFKAAVDLLGGIECVGYLQIRNEPFYFVNTKEGETSDRLKYSFMSYDEAEGLIALRRGNANRIFSVEQVTAIEGFVASKRGNRADLYTEDVYKDFVHKYHNQTPMANYDKF